MPRQYKKYEPYEPKNPPLKLEFEVGDKYVFTKTASAEPENMQLAWLNAYWLVFEYADKPRHIEVVERQYFRLDKWRKVT